MTHLPSPLMRTIWEKQGYDEQYLIANKEAMKQLRSSFQCKVHLKNVTTSSEARTKDYG